MVRVAFRPPESTSMVARLLGQQDRVIVGQQQDSRAEQDPLGRRRHEAEQFQRRGGMGRVGGNLNALTLAPGYSAMCSGT